MTPRIYSGRFDPKFLGVTIRARRTAEIHSFRFSDRSEPPELSVLAALHDEAVVSDLSRLTVLDHEIRHFHDALLYPMGLLATRARIFALFNGFETGIMLIRLRGEANVLVVPLQEWLVMPVPDREAFLRSEGRRTRRELRAPVLPVLNRDDDISEFRPGILEMDDHHEAIVTSCRLALAY
jgi:hypothetical protein